jgi:trehalose synthase
MVNVLQRCATIVVQNSLREGFGLTVTEGMWKGAPVLSNRRACDPRHQVRDGLDGRLVDDPENVEELADAIALMLADQSRLQDWGASAQRRAHEEFMVYKQLARWGRLVTQFLPP